MPFVPWLGVASGGEICSLVPFVGEGAGLPSSTPDFLEEPPGRRASTGAAGEGLFWRVDFLSSFSFLGGKYS